MLGLTIQCAQCHTHKYDPLTHTDYYRMFAFLNNCHEAQITVYTPEQRGRVAGDRTPSFAGIEDGLRAANPDWQERMAAWEAKRPQRPAGVDDRSARRPTHPATRSTTLQEDGSILAAGYAPTQ